MSDFKIKSSLCVEPPCRHRLPCITRGASASLSFDLSKKVYSFEDLDQVSFLFQQNNTIRKYDMIIYPEPNNRTNWEIDPHFSYDETYKCITFIFSSQETCQLQVTDEDSLLLFEVAVTLNTDQLISQQQDAVIIEKQHPIAVIDSIYAHSEEVDPDPQSAIVSATTVCSANLACSE